MPKTPNFVCPKKTSLKIPNFLKSLSFAPGTYPLVQPKWEVPPEKTIPSNNTMNKEKTKEFSLYYLLI